MDFTILTQLLQSYSYPIIFLLLLVEGPLVAYVAALSSSLGYFNLLYIAILAILGNIIGDIIYYLIGRASSNFHKPLKWFKVKEETIQHTKNILHGHTGKAMLLIKLTPPLVLPGLIIAGATHVPFKKFLLYSSLVSIPYSLFFVFMGYYSGVAYTTFAHYFHIGEIILVIFVALSIGLFFYFRKLATKLAKKTKL